MNSIYDSPKSDLETSDSVYLDSPRNISTTDWLFRFSGRLNRKQFWQFYLPYIFIGSLSILVSPLLWFVLNVILIWPAMAVQSKRWHDIGYSGLWSVIWFVPIIGWLMVLIQAGVYRGSRLKNRFGKSLYKKT